MTASADLTGTLVHHSAAALRPQPDRVVGRLFLPGEELPPGPSRAAAVVQRVLALPEPQVEQMAAGLLRDFGSRHRNYPEMLTAHAAAVSSRVDNEVALSPARTLVLGASFTAEYTLEGAALCNPSAVPSPDQTGLSPGQLRVAVSLRCIGEGHVSSIGFVSAVIGPGADWVFEPRAKPAVVGVNKLGRWRREHLRAVLTDQGRIDELAHAVLAALPDTFTGLDLDQALSDAGQGVLGRHGGQATTDLLRRLLASAYDVEFSADVELSSRTLMPVTAEESNGVEDARFVRFTGPSGDVEYRATYTAYDGTHIASRLLTTTDLRTFHTQRLAGPAARNKGMALFPRLIGGRHWSLCRSDGESTFVASSADGLSWGTAELVQQPEQPWETLQVGNCGPPIETPDGWLVLTHGVGPMRVYRIGAMLLDLDDPTRVLRRLEQPLLQPGPTEREGYVPHVVYSCGGVVHDGRLWLPYGIGDARIAVAWASVGDLLAAMSPVRG